MADYKIKFEYKGIGKQASGIRQKVLQSQKGGKKTGDTSAGSRETITSLKTLNTSINKLIASNKELSRKLYGGGGGGGGGFGGGRRGGRGKLGGGSAGFGRMGAAIPILGAGIAALGFTIQKVNQVGNAFIQKASQQIGNVGVGGFRYGQGTYTASQMGAGMKSYSTATGDFGTKTYIARNKKGKRYIAQRNVGNANKAALDVGAIYGQSAEESLGVAGQFKRSGADYGGTVDTALGSGIQSELPTLLTGMASILTEAVKNGVNTSDMSKDLGREITSLTMASPGKSVDAALNIVKSFSGVKQGVAGGKMGSVQSIYATKATHEMLMEKLTGKGGAAYRKKLVGEGFLSERQSGLLSGAKTFEDVQQMVPRAAWSLTRKFAAEVDPAALQKRSFGNLIKQYGDTEEGRQGAYDFAISHGMVENQAQMEIMSKSARGIIPLGAEGKGQGIREGRSKAVKGSAAGMAVGQINQRDVLALSSTAASFAATSLSMERAMIRLAKEAAPLAEKGIKKVGEAAIGLAAGIDALSKKLKAAKDDDGGFSLRKLFF